jgi:nucleotide-binding universal stress UspA family protein
MNLHAYQTPNDLSQKISSAGPHIKKILVFYDDSSESKSAFDFAAYQARSLGADVSVLVVGTYLAEAHTKAYQARAEAAWKTKFEELKQRDSAQDLKIDLHVAFGFPSWEIIKCANESRIDLIVLGQRRRIPFINWIMSGLARAMVSRAKCAVTVVR